MSVAAAAAQPVGAFDSGLGGLSILRAVRARLPHEDLIYVADAGYLPYGEKTVAEIQTRALTVSEFLIAQGAKAILVACNTATAAAIELLRERLPVPFVGVEPAIKPAVSMTRSGRIGVLATGATTGSVRLGNLLRRFGHSVEIIVQPCPGLVEQVEAGLAGSDETRRMVEGYVQPLVARGIDTLVLGCTHYPFLEQAIRAAAGPSVTLLDTGEPVARELARQLETRGLARSHGQGDERFWTSGTPASLAARIAPLWGRRVEVLPLSR